MKIEKNTFLDHLELLNITPVRFLVWFSLGYVTAFVFNIFTTIN